MGSAVAINTSGSVMINIDHINYGLAKSNVDKFINSVGGSGSSKKHFPGEQLSYKKGEWFMGFGDRQRLVKNGTELVFNNPNMGAGWVKWDENDSGKRFPKYTEMRYVAAGQDPIERSTLGDDDETQWEENQFGQVDDPWKPILFFPVRDADEAVINHVLLTSKSAVIAGFNLFRDLADDMKLHTGELPIVRLGTKKVTIERTEKDKKGREKKIKQTFDVPVFEVTGWADAIDADNPAKGGVMVTADSEAADLGKVEAKSRVKANGKANGKTTKALAAPVKGKAKSRRTVEAVEDEETL